MELLLLYLNSIHPLTEDLVHYLTTHLKTKELQKKEVLLKKGHIAREICFVESGLLRCFYLVDEKEVSAWFMKEGDVIISVDSFFNQTPGNETIQAIEACTIHYITYEELQFIYANFPEFDVVGRVLTEKYYALSEQRLCAMRMQRALDRYRNLMTNHPEFILRISSKYIASYLGVTEVTLSKIKSSI